MNKINNKIGKPNVRIPLYKMRVVKSKKKKVKSSRNKQNIQAEIDEYYFDL